MSLPILMAGGHLVLQRSFDPAGVMQAVAEHRVTVSFARAGHAAVCQPAPGFRTGRSVQPAGHLGGRRAHARAACCGLFVARGIPVNQGYGLTGDRHCDRLPGPRARAGQARLLRHAGQC
ncbi:hypothetical protein ACU4GD_24550 [Cupriavidus basilensis]